MVCTFFCQICSSDGLGKKEGHLDERREALEEEMHLLFPLRSALVGMQHSP